MHANDAPTLTPSNDAEPHAGQTADTIDEVLARKLKSLRLNAGKTQSEIARVLDISPQQYQKYEKGNSKCAIATVYRLAEYYQIPISDLLPATNIPSEGFAESGPAPYQTMNDTGPVDEATAMSLILNVLMRIPEHNARMKLVAMLNELV